MFDKKLYGTATVGSKGQIVIPADAREEMNIKTGDRLYVIGSKNREFVGFIKEAQLQQMIDHVTSNMQSFKDVMGESKEEIRD